MMHKDAKIYIAGHRGMVGSAVWRALEKKGYTQLIGKTSAQLDLRNQQAVLDFYKNEKPEVVIDAAARVGGILANKNFPYQFLMENMQIQNNLISGALEAGIEKFIFLGSSCRIISDRRHRSFRDSFTTAQSKIFGSTHLAQQTFPR